MLISFKSELSVIVKNILYKNIYKENQNIYKENQNIYKENQNIYKENQNHFLKLATLKCTGFL